MSVSFQQIESILDRFPPQPEHLISALQDVQANFNYISPAAMRAVCDHLGVPISRGWAVATFYTAFSLEPKGEHQIAVCMGTACHVRGAKNVYDKFRRDLGVPGPGRHHPGSQIHLAPGALPGVLLHGPGGPG